MLVALLLFFSLAATPQVATSSQNGTVVEFGAAIEVPAEGWRRRDKARELLAVATVHPIVYVSDGLKVRGYLAKPKTTGPHPAVIFNRGGNRDFGALTDEMAVHQLGTIASWGYVAVASQYRGNAGGEGAEQFGGAEVNDILNLIPMLERLPEADTKRLGMIGWSRGGMMTYLVLARTTRISAAVIGGGVANAMENIRLRPEMETVFKELVPNFAEEREVQLAARSAIRWPEKLNKRTPILLLHGTADWRVEPQQSLSMAAALLASKHPFRLIMFEGGDDSLTEYRSEVDEAEREWLDQYVRDQKQWPSLEAHGR